MNEIVSHKAKFREMDVDEIIECIKDRFKMGVYGKYSDLSKVYRQLTGKNLFTIYMALHRIHTLNFRQLPDTDWDTD